MITMNRIQARVSLVKNIMQALSEAKKNNVAEPDKKIIKILNGNIKWKVLKSRYCLK
jgi:hypothetical protein